MFNKDKFNELLVRVGELNTNDINHTNGAILNWSGPEFDLNVLNSTPEMIGKGDIQALQEIHIFLGPVWNDVDNKIDWNLVEKYNKVVALFNEIMKDSVNSASTSVYKDMKNPLLALNFVNLGYLTVMQSSLYVLSNNREEVIESTHMLAQLFKTAGFTVLREKIEASVHGINGIPSTAEEMAKYNKYFEFHIRVEHNDPNKDKVQLTGEELLLLEQISNDFKSKFLIPVPLSFNRTAHTDGGYQRYLNIRIREVGAPEALSKVKEVVDKINQTQALKVIKVISEFVWYDTFVDLDKGWIDF